jgi:hypothetical protein
MLYPTVTDNIDHIVRTSNDKSNGRGEVGVQKYALG